MLTTEEKIFEAARLVFQKKGFAAARMQEIADVAGINKAMLHYFYRNKQQLFEAVFKNAFAQIVPQLNEIFNSEESVFDKIKKFTHNYISFISQNQFLPAFIIQEMNNNPEFVYNLLQNGSAPNPEFFLKQIQIEIDNKVIKPINPKHLIMNILALCVFPFAAQTMVKGILQISEPEFEMLMQERKTLIAEQIINSIKYE